MPNVDPIFYVYEHWRPDLDVCFYVGKGKGRRAWGFRPRNPYYKNIVQKLASAGMCVEVRLVASALSEAQAFKLEVDRIEFWRRLDVRLSNVTSGGEGASGMKLSSDQRWKIAEALKGRPVSKATREKLRSSNLGKHGATPVTTAKLRESHRGKTASAETRQKMRTAQSARWASAEARAKHSGDVKKGYTPEVLKRMAELSRRRFSSPAARNKLRRYARARWHPEEVDP